jgi:GNAT superfamily N-acetyltransferase
MAATEGLGGYTATVDISAITILEAETKPSRRWVPVADMQFGRPTVAGRGGIETVLHRSTIVDPLAMERFPWAASAGEGADVVVTAMRRGGLAGVATETRRDDRLVTEGIEVVDSERRTGVGRALFDELRRIAGQAGLEATYANR